MSGMIVGLLRTLLCEKLLGSNDTGDETLGGNK